MIILYISMSNFLDIDFVIILNAKKSRHFDLSEALERLKRRDLLALSFITKFIYFVLIVFTVAFCVMIIHYFSFLNVNFRLNSVC